MSSVRQPQILSLRIDNLERRFAKSEASDAPIRKLLRLTATDELELGCGEVRLNVENVGTSKHSRR
jgi:hypothetical protein